MRRLTHRITQEGTNRSVARIGQEPSYWHSEERREASVAPQAPKAQQKAEYPCENPPLIPQPAVSSGPTRMCGRTS
jgi:hypothetical protein